MYALRQWPSTKAGTQHIRGQVPRTGCATDTSLTTAFHDSFADAGSVVAPAFEPTGGRPDHLCRTGEIRVEETTVLKTKTMYPRLDRHEIWQGIQSQIRSARLESTAF